MSEVSDVVITRVFDAPVERVWAAWTEPEFIQKWWGPEGFTAPHVSMDFKVGGSYLYAMHGPAGTPFDVDMWSTGTFEEIVPLKKIAHVQSFADAEGNIVSPATYGMAELPEKQQVIVEFEVLENNKTQLTLTYTGIPVGAQADSMRTGWNQSLDKMAVSLG